MRTRKEISGVIATFDEPSHAAHYVEELKQAGFTDDEIGVLSPLPSHTQDVEEDAVAGAITGGMIGALAGAVATGLIPGVGPVIVAGLLTGILGGVAGGAAVGGVLGALVGLGIPEDRARHHEREVLAGRTLVIVRAEARGGDALVLLRRCERSLNPVEAPLAGAASR
jgi:hypothetical protein